MIPAKKNILELPVYKPGKTTEQVERETGIKNAVKMASNENPFGPSPMAVDSLRSFCSEIHLYPDGDCSELKERLSEKLGFNPGRFVVGNGSNEVLELIAKVFLGPGDEAIYGAHGFVVYPIVTAGAGAKGVVSPMPFLKHDLKDFAVRITPKTRVVFLANPNNPTGTIFSKKEFEDFLEAVPKSVVVVIDEAYFEYVEDGLYPNSLDYQSAREGIVTVRTFSKIYGLAGARVGYAVASEKVASLLNRAKEPFNVSSLAQRAAAAALEDAAHCAVSRESNLSGLEYLSSQLDSLEITHTESRANFILADLGENSARIYEMLLREGFIVRPTAAYGLDTHIRITVGTAEQNAAFIAALKKVTGRAKAV